MKEIINYYYNFDIIQIEEYNTYATFKHLGEDFYFVFFNRTEEELKDLVTLTAELKLKGIRCHDIIINRLGNVLTKVGDNYYILLKLNANKDEEINFITLCEYIDKLKLNSTNSK